MTQKMLGIKASPQSANDLAIIVKKKEKFLNEKRNPPVYQDMSVTTAYFKALIDNIAEIELLEEVWWANATREYKLPDKVNFDFQTQEFYTEE